MVRYVCHFVTYCYFLILPLYYFVTLCCYFVTLSLCIVLYILGYTCEFSNIDFWKLREYFEMITYFGVTHLTYFWVRVYFGQENEKLKS